MSCSQPKFSDDDVVAVLPQFTQIQQSRKSDSVPVAALESQVAMWKERAESAAAEVVGVAAGAAATVAAVEKSTSLVLSPRNQENQVTCYQNGVVAGRMECAAELAELQEQMDDLLVCLGQESNKVDRLRAAMEERCIDVDDILADLIMAEDAEIDALVGVEMLGNVEEDTSNLGVDDL